MLLLVLALFTLVICYFKYPAVFNLTYAKKLKNNLFNEVRARSFVYSFFIITFKYIFYYCTGKTCNFEIIAFLHDEGNNDDDNSNPGSSKENNKEEASKNNDINQSIPRTSFRRGPLIIVTDPDGVTREHNDPLDKGKQKMPSDYEIKKAEDQIEESDLTLRKLHMNMQRLEEIDKDCEASSTIMSKLELAKKYDSDYWDVANEVGNDIEKLSDLNKLESKNDVIQETVFNPLKRKLEDIEKDFGANQKRFMDKMPELDVYESIFESDLEDESD